MTSKRNPPERDACRTDRAKVRSFREPLDSADYPHRSAGNPERGGAAEGPSRILKIPVAADGTAIHARHDQPGPMKDMFESGQLASVPGCID